MAGEARAGVEAGDLRVTAEAELGERLMRSRGHGVAGRAVVSLVTRRAAVAIDSGLAAVRVFAPAEIVIPWAHQLVALVTGVAWRVA